MKVVLLLFLTIACSSTNKLDQAKKSYKLSEIQESDFIRMKPLKYTLASDRHLTQEQMGSSLFSETLSLQSSDELENMIESQNTISSALAKCYLGKISEGLKTLKNEYDRYRRNPSFWNAQGICFFLNKEVRKAVVFYNKALEQYSKYAPAYNNLGVSYLQLGKHQKAMVAFQKASSFKKSNFSSRYNQLSLYLFYSLLGPADLLLNQLEKNYGGNIRIQNARAVWHMMSGQDPKAVSLFAAFGDEKLEKPQYGLNFVVALFRMGQQEKARDYFDDIEKDELGDLRDYYTRVASYIGDTE